MISVIIATRDRALLLRGALEAVSGQVSPGCPVEILVVDNGSMTVCRLSGCAWPDAGVTASPVPSIRCQHVIGGRPDDGGPRTGGRATSDGRGFRTRLSDHSYRSTSQSAAAWRDRQMSNQTTAAPRRPRALVRLRSAVGNDTKPLRAAERVVTSRGGDASDLA
jgi:hypothetical protein